MQPDTFDGFTSRTVMTDGYVDTRPASVDPAVCERLAAVEAAIINIDGTLQAVVAGVNAIGEQTNWLVTNLGKAFDALETMREAVASMGPMGLVKSIMGGGKNG